MFCVQRCLWGLLGDRKRRKVLSIIMVTCKLARDGSDDAGKATAALLLCLGSEKDRHSTRIK